MIVMLRGQLVRQQADRVIIDVGGVGYGVNVPSSTASRLPAVGDTVTLYAYTHVREDVLALYGFATEDELLLFEDIISVSGMGPRLALTSLSTLRPHEFRHAVANEDVSALTRISGVGKKTAQRLILELKGKLTPAADDALPAPDTAGAPPVADDALAALVALGYTEAEALPALQLVQKETGDAAARADTATLLRNALRHLAG